MCISFVFSQLILFDVLIITEYIVYVFVCLVKVKVMIHMFRSDPTPPLSHIYATDISHMSKHLVELMFEWTQFSQSDLHRLAVCTLAVVHSL